MENFIVTGDLPERIITQTVEKLKAGYTRVERIKVGNHMTIIIFRRTFWTFVCHIFKRKKNKNL